MLSRHRFLNLFPVIALLFVSVFFIRCASTNFPAFLHPDYTEKQRPFSSLLVLPLTNAFLTRAQQDSLSMGKPRFVHYLHHTDKRYFDTYFRNAVIDAVQASIPRMDPYYIPHDLEFEYMSLPLPDGSGIRMFAPASGMIVYRNTIPNFLLFIEDLRLEKNFSVERGARGLEGEHAETVMVLEYLFWDNTREQIAAYGSLSKKFEFLGAPTKENYLRMFGEIAGLIAEQSPFTPKIAISDRSRRRYP